MKNLSKIGQETKKLQKMGNGVIVTSFLKIGQQFFVCEYFLLIPISVPSFKLIEGQIKELQGMVPNTPRAENDHYCLTKISIRAKRSISASFPCLSFPVPFCTLPVQRPY